MREARKTYYMKIADKFMEAIVHNENTGRKIEILCDQFRKISKRTAKFHSIPIQRELYKRRHMCYKRGYTRQS